ncbi:MAG: peptidase M28, partial [Nitrospinaceae bacterium]|nr:peptidase M28 [Nitrospinaceae bacterium]NIS87668.1 peptidase M28 [Nitrospinaceae bacterium]NIT84534.1 peptidase M28 [Nitrospinaceae bacterium]NIU98917.1 peptidase M28 [Nitrospinaceae bacterium]NIW08285.1 peptidase M28 [Nitrospinaceae bacterium]
PETGDFIAVVGNQPSVDLTRAVTEGMKRTHPGLRVEHLVVPGRGTEFVECNLSDHSP